MDGRIGVTSLSRKVLKRVVHVVSRDELLILSLLYELIPPQIDLPSVLNGSGIIRNLWISLILHVVKILVVEIRFFHFNDSWAVIRATWHRSNSWRILLVKISYIYLLVGLVQKWIVQLFVILETMIVLRVLTLALLNIFKWLIMLWITISCRYIDSMRQSTDQWLVTLVWERICPHPVTGFLVEIWLGSFFDSRYDFLIGLQRWFNS